MCRAGGGGGGDGQNLGLDTEKNVRMSQYKAKSQFIRMRKKCAQ